MSGQAQEFHRKIDPAKLGSDISAVDSFESWDLLLEHVREMERGKLSMLVSYDFSNHRGRIHAADNVTSSYKRSYAERYAAHHDPWAARAKDVALPGTVWSGDQILSKSERTSNQFYNEWL